MIVNLFAVEQFCYIFSVRDCLSRRGRGGGYLLERFIYALARSFEHLLDFSSKYIVIVYRQAFNIATNTRYRIRNAQNDV